MCIYSPQLPSRRRKFRVFRSVSFYGAELQPLKLGEALENPNCGWRYSLPSHEFVKIPGSLIAYWALPHVISLFTHLPTFTKIGETLQGMTTCDNDFYLRYWWEVAKDRIGLGCNSREQANKSGKKWFPYTKGGPFRKWFGNNEYVVNWENDGSLLRTRKHPTLDKVWAHNFNLVTYLKRAQHTVV